MALPSAPTLADHFTEEFSDQFSMKKISFQPKEMSHVTSPLEEELRRMHASREAWKRLAERAEETVENQMFQLAIEEDTSRTLRQLLAAVTEEARADTEALHDDIDSLKQDREEMRLRMRANYVAQYNLRLDAERELARLEEKVQRKRQKK